VNLRRWSSHRQPQSRNSVRRSQYGLQAKLSRRPRPVNLGDYCANDTNVEPLNSLLGTITIRANVALFLNAKDESAVYTPHTISSSWPGPLAVTVAKVLHGEVDRQAPSVRVEKVQYRRMGRAVGDVRSRAVRRATVSD
jgi:hypothetical protein